VIDWLLDKSIYFSFDKSGYKRHQRSFQLINFEQGLGTILITGGSDGIGASLRDSLLENNQKVIITGRSEKKFIQHPNLTNKSLDLSNWEDIKSFAKELPVIGQLVLNAGGMPEEYSENSEGFEYQLSSQLLGHLVLFNELHKQKKLSPSAKILITSSGGMLLKKLNLEELFHNKNYDKVSTYANVKRAQVIIWEELAQIYPEYTWASMHPGWVKTRAVTEALPGFYNFTQKRLREPSEGADTLLWLLYQKNLPNGEFWFDRKIAKIYPFPGTQESSENRKSLLEKVFKAISLSN
jgi:dehydrogenase/reductase SDR family protein 12